MQIPGTKTIRRACRPGQYHRLDVGWVRACLAPLVLAVALAGCASGGDNMLLLVDGGKYQYHNCAQIAEATKNMSNRRQELGTLIERAEQSPGGALVSAMAYRTDYTAAGQDLQLLEHAARDKQCNNPAAWRSNSVIQ
jgi:hypothetical protein